MPKCCRAFTAECMSCSKGVSVQQYCKEFPSTSGCEKYLKQDDNTINNFLDGVKSIFDYKLDLI